MKFLKINDHNKIITESKLETFQHNFSKTKISLINV